MDLLTLAVLAVLIVFALLTRAVFTWRFLGLAALGLPLLLLAGWRAWPLQIVFLAYNGSLGLLLLLDLLLSSRQRDFVVTRTMEGVLSLGIANQVGLEIQYRGAYRTKAVLRDEPPPEFRAAGPNLPVSLMPGRTASASYAVVPPRRGLFDFGRIHLRYRGRLGLIIRQTHFASGVRIKVYPNILAGQEFALLARTGRLGEMGLRTARLTGTGTSFERVREYVPGDEFRWINWKATARRGRAQTNEYQIEQAQNIFLLLDAGRLMVTKAGTMARFDHAINAALMLAYVAASKGDRVGAMVFGEGIKGYLVPGKGPSQVGKLIEFLYPIQPELMESDYRAAFTYFAAKNHKRGLVCVFTDLIDEEVSGLLLAYLSALSPPHVPVCITLRDPLLDAARQAEIGGLEEVYTKAVAEQILADRARARRHLERRGVVVIDVPPEELSVAVVNQYLELKERGRI